MAQEPDSFRPVRSSRSEESGFRPAGAPGTRTDGFTPASNQVDLSRQKRTKPAKSGFKRFLLRTAAWVAGAAIVTGIAYHYAKLEVTEYIIKPYRDMVDYNTGRKVYNPREGTLTPAQKGEGFVCPGTMLYGERGMGSTAVVAPTKVKVVGNPDAQGETMKIKLVTGLEEKPNDPVITIYRKDFRTELSCR